MAEEEGFTFVDKRRTQVDAAAEAEASNSTVDEPVGGAADDASENSDINPDVYGMIGYCISLLSAEAWQKLGLITNPQTGQVQADLDQAKVAIDTVGDLAVRLESAPAEIVPETYRRDLRTLLNDLRLNYVGQRNQLGG